MQGTDGRGVAGPESSLGRFNPTVPSPARVWDYLVGGKDNFAADRALAEQLLEAVPEMPIVAQLTRQFIRRAVEELVMVYGVRQFLDIGSGLPTAENTHEVAQRAAPESRIVYVDSDPVVIRHFIPDSDDPYGIVARLMAALPSGSFLVMVHGASDLNSEVNAELTRRYNRVSSAQLSIRTFEEFSRFFTGLEPIGPGLVSGLEWLRTGGAELPRLSAGMTVGHSGIARKP
jgi:S-adenosyl methyltransferase